MKMFKTHVYLRGLKQPSRFWSIENNILYFEPDIHMNMKALRVYDIVEVDKFFFGILYSSKSYLIKEPADQLQL